MFETLQNTVQIGFTLVPDGPILVRAQTVGLDPGVADMEFQRTHRNGRSTVFLAGSGLKGVIRSHAERLLRSREVYACDPTLTKSGGDRNDAACGSRKKDDKEWRGEKRDPSRPHAGQCAACFTFGSLHLAGRFRIGDAYPTEEQQEEANLTEVRTGVGIDRKSQSAQRGVLYDSEVVVRGGFAVKMQGENYSLWQIGLILAALDDLGAGVVRIGGCKARGMGAVKVEGLKVELGFLGGGEGKLLGARKMASTQGEYFLPEADSLEAPEGALSGSRGLFRTLTYTGDPAKALQSSLIDRRLDPYIVDRQKEGH
jgi:CRISPR-associated protein Csm3